MLIRSPTLSINTMHAMSMKPDPPTSEELANTAIMPSSSSSSTSFNLENRILKGSERNSNDYKPRKALTEYTTININHPQNDDNNNAPHIQPVADDEEILSNGVALLALVMMLVCILYMLIDYTCNGPCRRSTMTRPEHLTKLSDAATVSARRLQSSTTIVPIKLASTQMIKSTLKPLASVSQLPQYVQYTNEGSTKTKTTTR